MIRRTAVWPLVLCICTPIALGAPVVPIFRLMGRGGDPFPGRPGFVYDGGASAPFVGGRSNDPNGDIYFQARARASDGTTVEDLLVFRHATGVTEPYVRSGDPLEGSPLRLVWGVVGGGQVGVMSHLGVLEDGSPGGRQMVLVSRPDGTRFVAGREGQTAPGQDASITFTSVGQTSGSFRDVNLNDAGAVTFGGRFRDATNATRYGYYLTQPGGTAERIIDSTMPVPDHPTATWQPYDGITLPFDIYTPGIDHAGNAYFRAKFNEAGSDYRALYKRAADGTITTLADTFSAESVPGLPGRTIRGFRGTANNQHGDVVFGADLSNADGTNFGPGVFAIRAGQPMTKVLARGDAVPGIPEAINHSPGLIAMNETGHLLLTVNYALSGQSGQSLLLYARDGTAEPVLKFNEVPGFPGQRATSTIAADLNSFGDAAFIARVTGGTNYAAFAYLNETDQLVPLLRTGDVLEGMTVVSFLMGGGADEPLGSIGASGGPVSWDDRRILSLNVVLRDAAGQQRYSVYSVQVPEPSTVALLLLAGSVLRVRRA